MYEYYFEENMSDVYYFEKNISDEYHFRDL